MTIHKMILPVLVCVAFVRAAQDEAGPSLSTDAHEFDTTVRDRLQRSPGRGFAFVFASGCVSPIHAGHVSLLEGSVRAAEKQGYNVLGGFFTVNPDKFCMKKHYEKPAFIKAEYRVKMVEIALRESELPLFYGEFSGKLVDYKARGCASMGELYKNTLNARFADALQGRKITMIRIAGSDRYGEEGWRDREAMKDQVYCVGLREGDKITVHEDEGDFACVDNSTGLIKAASSSKARKLTLKLLLNTKSFTPADNLRLAGMLPRGVYDYLIKNYDKVLVEILDHKKSRTYASCDPASREKEKGDSAPIQNTLQLPSLKRHRSAQ